jgi:DNA-binding transcriptional MocR family regulator
MRGKPFQSKLEPHFDFIREARRKRQTWQAIVELLAAQGIITSRPAVYSFMKRRLKRRYPLGMAPDEPRPATAPPNPAQAPAPELPYLPESLPPPSEFGPDPLTLSTKKKWGIVAPT